MGRVVEKIVFDVDPGLKRRWMDLCRREGVTQAEMFRRMVAKEDARMTENRMWNPGSPNSSRLYDVQAQAWEGYVGNQSPEEFMGISRQTGHGTIEDAVDSYVSEMEEDRDDLPGDLRELLQGYIERQTAGTAIMVQERDGTYEIPGSAESEDWADVRTAALGEGAEIDEGAPLTGWGQYTRVYRITYPSGDVLTYFVAE